MKVQLEKTYTMPAAAPVVWAALQDIEAVAGCMPGAKITERIDERHYKGTVAVRFGPANLSFRGEVEVRAIEPATCSLQLVAKGTDTSGSSAAAMDLTARVEKGEEAAQSRLVGTSEVSMSGKAATFGARMAGAVADQVLGQFAGNFAALVSVRAAAAVPAASATAQPTDGGATDPVLPAGSTVGPAAPNAPVLPPPARAVAPEPAPLNAFAIAWAVLRDWLRSLVSARRS